MKFTQRLQQLNCITEMIAQPEFFFSGDVSLQYFKSKNSVILLLYGLRRTSRRCFCLLKIASYLKGITCDRKTPTCFSIRLNLSVYFTVDQQSLYCSKHPAQILRYMPYSLVVTDKTQPHVSDFN